MVRAFAGDSTMTRLLPIGADTLAPLSTVTGARYCSRGIAAPAELALPPHRRAQLAGAEGPLPASGERAENVSGEGGLVLAANHWSNFDPWPLGDPVLPAPVLPLHGQGGALLVPARHDHRRRPAAFKVRRGEQDEEAIATAVALARDGHIVVMFPEGTRRKKGCARSTRRAGARARRAIALEAGVPLVPAGIAGTERLARLGPLRVAYGPPIEVGRSRRLRPDEAAASRPTGSPTRARAGAQRRMRPLLVVDGDSFAHRAYHALPKSMRAPTAARRTRSSASRTCSCGSGRTSGRARCWSPGTRSTSRRTATPRSRRTRAGASSTDELLEQLDLLPTLVEAMGFAAAKAPGYEADDFLAAGVAFEEAAGGSALVATRRPRRLPARRATDDRAAARGGRRRRRGSGRPRCASATASSPPRCPTSSPCAATRPTGSRARAESARRRPPRCSRSTARSRRCSRRGASPPRRTLCGSTGTSRRWIARAAAAARRPGADVGHGRGARPRVGTRPARRAAERRCRPPDQPGARRAAPDGDHPRAARAPLVLEGETVERRATARAARARPRARPSTHRGRRPACPARCRHDLLATSWAAATLAAGITLEAVDRGAFALVRPPGPPRARGAGDGLLPLNNVAVAARYAQEELGLERVAIVDFDVHHGNGTEAIFRGDDSVLSCRCTSGRSGPVPAGRTERRVDPQHPAPRRIRRRDYSGGVRDRGRAGRARVRARARARLGRLRRARRRPARRRWRCPRMGSASWPTVRGARAARRRRARGRLQPRDAPAPRRRGAAEAAGRPASRDRRGRAAGSSRGEICF